MSPRMAFFAAALALVPAAALAETDAEKAEREARIKAAVEACDKAASVPLDPDARAAPVQFAALFSTFSDDGLSKVVESCRTASSADPGNKRLKLEYLRTALMLGRDPIEPIAAGIEALAAEGSPEANYLLFRAYVIAGDAAPGLGIDRDAAIAGLTAAADAGHEEALTTIVFEYWQGGTMRRDLRKAVGFAGKLMNMPPQGSPPGATEEDSRHAGRRTFAALPIMSDIFDDAERAKAWELVRPLYEGGDDTLVAPYITAYRYGRGVAQDAAKARALAEEAVADGKSRALPILAEMLANGEGGAADGRRALTLLTSDLAQETPYTKPVLAALYLDNHITGRRPREAALLLATANDIDSKIKAASLLADYDVRLDYPKGYLKAMEAAAEAGEPGAAMVLVRLKLSNHPDFGNDDTGARAILARLAAGGDREAALLLAETTYGDLGDSDFNPTPRDGLMSEAEIKAVVDKGIADGIPAAFRVKARFQRVGVLYPQDDAAATQALVQAAEKGDVGAMLLLGDAYDDGLGTPENPRERLRWWREAARLGSLAAREKLARAFVFDSFDKLMTLREGITAKVALYNDSGETFMSPEMELMGLFQGGRAGDAGPAALAAATMDAFRMAPAGLDDKKLVPLVRALPDEIRLEIEKALKRDGFYSGTPSGNFGPDTRAALAAWVEAKGPLPDEESEAAGPPAVSAEALPQDVVDRLRDRVFATANTLPESASNEDRLALIARFNALAGYGDLASRWVLVKNYHQADLIRAGVTPEEITRYGLDILVSRPEGIEKAEFEFIFDLSSIYEQGKGELFGKAFVDAVRDDPRLHDPLTLGGILQQIMFAPGACDAVLAALAAAGVKDAGGDGCSEEAKTALIAHATSAGPAGIEPAARKDAATALAKLDAEGG